MPPIKNRPENYRIQTMNTQCASPCLLAIFSSTTIWQLSVMPIPGNFFLTSNLILTNDVCQVERLHATYTRSKKTSCVGGCRARLHPVISSPFCLLVWKGVSSPQVKGQAIRDAADLLKSHESNGRVWPSFLAVDGHIRSLGDHLVLVISRRQCLRRDVKECQGKWSRQYVLQPFRTIWMEDPGMKFIESRKNRRNKWRDKEIVTKTFWGWPLQAEMSKTLSEFWKKWWGCCLNYLLLITRKHIQQKVRKAGNSVDLLEGKQFIFSRSMTRKRWRSAVSFQPHLEPVTSSTVHCTIPT